MKKSIFSTKNLVLFVLIPSILCVSILAAAFNYTPTKRGDGKQAETIMPQVNMAGESAEVLIPEAVDETEEDEPYEPFIPEFEDDEPFVDMDSSYDFSKQYDYSYAGMSPVNGSCDEADGVYTATTSSSMYVHRSSYAPFPYGTISADVMNNGGDCGIVFGLSSNYDTFWEGTGVSYYFAFINWDGILYLGKTDNNQWYTLTYADISGFSASTTYNVKVLYRIDKIVVFLNDVPVLSYRTTSPLEGTGWGIRTGAVGAKISNISVSNKVTVE